MCLTKSCNINATLHTLFRKTKKDIIVYKAVIKLKNRKNQYKALYRKNYYYNLGEHHYQLGKSVEEKFPDAGIKGCWGICLIVKEGLHASISLEEAKHHVRDCRNLCILRCIIPEGSWYVKGEDGDIVTDNLIVYEEIE